MNELHLFCTGSMQLLVKNVQVTTNGSIDLFKNSR